MRLIEKLHFLHRAWRYRLRSEREELAHVFSRDLRGATVLDIGANRGIYSYWMHRLVGATGHVVAFEPQPELGGQLHDLKATFRLHRLRIVTAGLSSRPGERTMVRPRSNWAGGSFHLSADLPDTDCLSVPVTTLDEYFSLAGRDLPPVRFIKCDVQDHEEDVFRGGEQLLREHRPELLFEQVEECWETGRVAGFLQGLGYCGHFLYRGQLMPIERLPELRSQIRRPYLNYVFTMPQRVRSRVVTPRTSAAEFRQSVPHIAIRSGAPC